MTELKDAHVEVGDLTGTADHLDIFVASNAFKGLVLIDQHQIIMNILKESLKERIHAVKLKTMTLDKFKQTK
ncbi:MAG: BolA/IbaG family iron-sulfur metabolism protein [Bacteriovoracaceae bacterium]|nr:BolA/IbaG family iron-sulfur metabolism protein [Bacteriovoracaceae bacterium]